MVQRVISYLSCNLQTINEISDRRLETFYCTVDPNIGMITIGHHPRANAFSLFLKKCRELIAKPASLLDTFLAVVSACEGVPRMSS